jgi:hypothetical protein
MNNIIEFHQETEEYTLHRLARIFNNGCSMNVIMTGFDEYSVLATDKTGEFIPFPRAEMDGAVYEASLEEVNAMVDYVKNLYYAETFKNEKE